MLFKRAPIEDFAKKMAADLAKRYPVAIDQQPDKRPSVNRLTRVVEDVCERAAAFGAEHKLSWYGRAKLGNSFRWELVELGYSKQFVDLATEAVVVHASGAVRGHGPSPRS
jgi:hypothetical protein